MIQSHYSRFITAALLLFFAVSPIDAKVSTQAQLSQPSQASVQAKAPIIETLYGKALAEPVIVQLLETKAMQRIRDIDQSGALVYFGYVPRYTRYEHSVGVWSLLKKVNRPIAEQVAGLLHDVSHTVFSHTGDYLFQQGEEGHAYQDSIHLWFLEKMKIQDVLKPFQLTLEEVEPDNGHNIALEQNLPHLCADRIEYNLKTGLLFKKISQEEFNAIRDDLHFENGRWFFTNAALAKKFASLSLDFTQSLWGAPWNDVFNHYIVEMLQEGLKTGLISQEQIHFGTDKQVIDLLRQSNSPYIQKRLKACAEVHKTFKVVQDDTTPYDKLFKTKFRGVDPLVKTKEGFQPLTAIDAAFKHEYAAVQAWTKRGTKVVFLEMDA